MILRLSEGKTDNGSNLQLIGRAQSASSEVQRADMKKVDGMRINLEALDRVLGQDMNWKCFKAYLASENIVLDKTYSIY